MAWNRLKSLKNKLESNQTYRSHYVESTSKVIQNGYAEKVPQGTQPKEGRRELKRYGVLFTCMASRAIQLEVAATLETDSLINALRRFVCRRDPIRQLRSDQGTNFVGARRELKEALDELSHTKIRSELQRHGCDRFVFKLNVPSASHMGGCGNARSVQFVMCWRPYYRVMARS